MVGSFPLLHIQVNAVGACTLQYADVTQHLLQQAGPVAEPLSLTCSCVVLLQQHPACLPTSFCPHPLLASAAQAYLTKKQTSYVHCDAGCQLSQKVSSGSHVLSSIAASLLVS